MQRGYSLTRSQSLTSPRCSFSLKGRVGLELEGMLSYLSQRERTIILAEEPDSICDNITVIDFKHVTPVSESTLR